jgi:hypothetical protein
MATTRVGRNAHAWLGLAFLILPVLVSSACATVLATCTLDVYSAALLSATVLVFCIRAPMHLHATSKLPGEDETNDAVSPHHLLGL